MITLKLGLTPEQRAARNSAIGGSDASRIMSGDWFALWSEKTGRTPPEDLSGNFAVQMGSITEPLNLAWYERKTGHELTRVGEVATHPEHAFLRCTLDGFDAAVPAVVQAKHVNAFSKLPDIVARYTPQVTHEMLCCGVGRAVLSVIIGTNEPALETVDLDEFYAAQYLDQAKAFWRHVVENRPPSQGAAVAPPPPPEVYRDVDMTGNNRFALLAGDWLASKGPAATFDAATKGLKAMIEPDVGAASGYGVVVKRDKRGLAIKEMR